MNDEIINAILVTSAKPFAVFTLFRKNMENRDLIAKRMRVASAIFFKNKKNTVCIQTAYSDMHNKTNRSFNNGANIIKEKTFPSTCW